MYVCSDKLGNIYKIDNFRLLNQKDLAPTKIFCPYCRNEVRLRSHNSNKKAHFFHLPNTSCSATNYSYLFKGTTNKKTKNEILALKFNIFSSSYDIYKHIEKTFNITLTHNLFLDILDKLIKFNILELVDMSPEIIPYVWINTLKSYKQNNNIKTYYLYTNSCNNEYKQIWNFYSDKNIILRIEEIPNSSSFSYNKIPVELDFISKNIYGSPNLSFIQKIVPRIFDVLKIPKIYEDLLLKDLLNEIEAPI